MAWATPIIHAVGDILTASDWNISSNDLSFLSGTAGATVVTSQSSGSAIWADLATVGPQVTVTTGANAVAIMSCVLSNNTANQSTWMGVAVTGATTIAAPAGTNALYFISPVGAVGTQCAGLTFISGLTAGSNTFTAKYQVGANTGTWSSRTLVVVPLP